MVSRSKPILPSIPTHPAGGPQQWCNCHPRKGRILLVEGHLVVELTLKDNKCIPVQNHLSKDNVLTRKQIDLCTWRCITTQALTQNTALRSLTKRGNYLKNKNKKKKSAYFHRHKFCVTAQVTYGISYPRCTFTY